MLAEAFGSLTLTLQGTLLHTMSGMLEKWSGSPGIFAYSSSRRETKTESELMVMMVVLMVTVVI